MASERRDSLGRRLPKTDEHRFGEKLAHDPETGCIHWLGGLNRDGYGRFTVDGMRVLAHHWSNGKPPDGLVTDHLCRNRRCVNPDHLEFVTNRENILRGSGLSARRSRQTHCRKGHPLNTKNTKVEVTMGRRPARRCLTCYSEWHKDNDARRSGRQDRKSRPRAQPSGTHAT